MPQLPKLSPRKRLLAHRNAKQAAQLEVIASCAAVLEQEKARLQLAGLEPTWANFETQPEFPAMMAGIDEATKTRLKQLWEGT